MQIKQSIVVPIAKPKEVGLDDFCRTVKEIGFDAIEIWFRDNTFEKTIEVARRHGLQMASMCGHGTMADGLACEPQHDRIEAELRESIDLAAEHHIHGLIAITGNRLPDQTDTEGLQTCARVLQRIAPYAHEKGVNINIELLNTKVDHPGYLGDRICWGVALCEMVNSPHVKLLFDIYHMQIMEGDIIRNIRDAVKWIGHFHTAGNPGRSNIDDSQELNYRSICNAISATDYGGFVGHEFRPSGDWRSAIRSAYEICNAG